MPDLGLRLDPNIKLTDKLTRTFIDKHGVGKALRAYCPFHKLQTEHFDGILVRYHLVPS
ncbi:MAG: hypothetical protein ACD_25C00168G0005 [uncultured bacterium]|nr:MAG: hypothetical protein ACD_25C00168G0005 [uncultured bacterium]